MSELSAAQARALLPDAASLWRVSPGTTADLIDAAVECLVTDIDSPTLRELAGASTADSQFVLDVLIEKTLTELGMQDVLTASVQRAALEAMLRSCQQGQVILREFSSWAHRDIGHDGDADCQVFVDLDDMYDDVVYSGRDLLELERWACATADAFLAGEPATTYSWPPREDPAS